MAKSNTRWPDMPDEQLSLWDPERVEPHQKELPLCSLSE